MSNIGAKHTDTPPIRRGFTRDADDSIPVGQPGQCSLRYCNKIGDDTRIITTKPEYNYLVRVFWPENEANKCRIMRYVRAPCRYIGNNITTRDEPNMIRQMRQSRNKKYPRNKKQTVIRRERCLMQHNRHCGAAIYLASTLNWLRWLLMHNVNISQGYKAKTTRQNIGCFQQKPHYKMQKF